MGDWQEIKRERNLVLKNVTVKIQNDRQKKTMNLVHDATFKNKQKQKT